MMGKTPSALNAVDPKAEVSVDLGKHLVMVERPKPTRRACATRSPKAAIRRYRYGLPPATIDLSESGDTLQSVRTELVEVPIPARGASTRSGDREPRQCSNASAPSSAAQNLQSLV